MFEVNAKKPMFEVNAKLKRGNLPGRNIKSLIAPRKVITGCSFWPGPGNLMLVQNARTSSFWTSVILSHTCEACLLSFPQKHMIMSRMDRNCLPSTVATRTVEPGTISSKGMTLIWEMEGNFAGSFYGVWVVTCSFEKRHRFAKVQREFTLTTAPCPALWAVRGPPGSSWAAREFVGRPGFCGPPGSSWAGSN